MSGVFDSEGYAEIAAVFTILASKTRSGDGDAQFPISNAGFDFFPVGAAVVDTNIIFVFETAVFSMPNENLTLCIFGVG